MDTNQQKPKDFHADLIRIARKYGVPVNVKDTVELLVARIFSVAVTPEIDAPYREVFGIALTAEIDFFEKFLVSDLLKPELNE